MASDRKPALVTRRVFISHGLLASASSAFIPASSFLIAKSWLSEAFAATADATVDTFNGLLAFVAPGSDSYSTAQGVSTPELGGVGVGATNVLIATVDVGGPFLAPFANLSFAAKAGVFRIMDGTAALQLLAGILPPFAAFFAYSEAGAFDPVTRTLTSPPLGWTLSQYRGVSDGRAEFLGYFRDDDGR
jgi:hypothetical protein